MSRVFGLVRDQVFAALLGAGFYSDAFIIAFRIPNLLRDLFAEGALSSAFVPTFTEYEVKNSTAEAWRLANLVIGVLLVVVGGLTLLGMIFTPGLVSLIAPGFNSIPGKGELTVFLARIMFPFLPVIAISALFMGMLNVKGRFGVPAFAPVMFNLVSIAFGVALWTAGVPVRTAVIGWSVGTLLGGLAQGLVQVPSLLKLGWRFRPSLAGWRESAGLRQIALLMVPAVIGLSATQVNILVNSILASLLEQGAPSWLNYAFRLMQLPIGVFGVAIGIVTLPRVARDAANASRESLKANLTSSINLVFLLTVPAAVGLWILGVPIIRLIYEHGIFRSSDTVNTAAALSVYAIGLPAYAAVKVLAPAFYALKDARSPVMASVMAVTVCIVFNLTFYRTLGFQGLALGTSLAELCAVSFLLVRFQRKHGGLLWGMLFKRFLQFVLASALMGVVAYYTFAGLQSAEAGLGSRLLETLAPIVAGAAVYFAVLHALRVPEMSVALDAARRIYNKFF